MPRPARAARGAPARARGSGLSRARAARERAHGPRPCAADRVAERRAHPLRAEPRDGGARPARRRSETVPKRKSGAGPEAPARALRRPLRRSFLAPPDAFPRARANTRLRTGKGGSERFGGGLCGARAEHIDGPRRTARPRVWANRWRTSGDPVDWLGHLVDDARLAHTDRPLRSRRAPPALDDCALLHALPSSVHGCAVPCPRAGREL